MITEPDELKPNSELKADVCVVGAGAAGMSVAVELGRAGISTLLMPGGSRKYSREYQDLYMGSSNLGISLERSRQRRFGGTTAVWGGRCIPFDPIDFEPRDYVDHSGWPFDHRTLDRYYQRAQEYLDVGSSYPFVVETVLPDAPPDLIEGFTDDAVLTNHVEKWSLPTNLGEKYYEEIRHSTSTRLLGDTHVVELVTRDGEIDFLRCVVGSDGERLTCRASVYVLAMGGLETTRHLLHPTPEYPNGIGNHSGALGRFFMTHFSGVIADVVIDPSRAVISGFETDDEGIYCRRRIQISGAELRRQEILNFSSHFYQLPPENPRHGDAMLSLIFLAKGLRDRALRIPADNAINRAFIEASPSDYWSHIRNIVKGLPGLVLRSPEIVFKRIIRRRKLPAVVVDSGSNRFPLLYHVEHAPYPDSRVTLTQDRDAHGLRRLHLDLHYEDLDVESIIRAHMVIKERLEHAEAGTIEFLSADPRSHVVEQIDFGGHQLGTTRMAVGPEDGVVDANCKVFGVRNLFLASPSVFPTGGQANPVFTIVAMALRLADHLSDLLTNGRNEWSLPP